jgi:uncharacterized protein YaeQ
VIAAWDGKRIHQLEQITVQSFDPGFMDRAVAVLERRNTMTVTRTDGQVYLDLNGEALSSSVHVHRLG